MKKHRIVILKRPNIPLKRLTLYTFFFPHPFPVRKKLRMREYNYTALLLQTTTQTHSLYICIQVSEFVYLYYNIYIAWYRYRFESIYISHVYCFRTSWSPEACVLDPCLSQWDWCWCWWWWWKVLSWLSHRLEAVDSIDEAKWGNKHSWSDPFQCLILWYLIITQCCSSWYSSIDVLITYVCIFLMKCMVASMH